MKFIALFDSAMVLKRNFLDRESSIQKAINMKVFFLCNNIASNVLLFSFAFILGGYSKCIALHFEMWFSTWQHIFCCKSLRDNVYTLDKAQGKYCFILHRFYTYFNNYMCSLTQNTIQLFFSVQFFYFKLNQFDILL